MEGEVSGGRRGGTSALVIAASHSDCGTISQYVPDPTANESVPNAAVATRRLATSTITGRCPNHQLPRFQTANDLKYKCSACDRYRSPSYHYRNLIPQVSPRQPQLAADVGRRRR